MLTGTRLKNISIVSGGRSVNQYFEEDNKLIN